MGLNFKKTVYMNLMKSPQRINSSTAVKQSTPYKVTKRKTGKKLSPTNKSFLQSIGFTVKKKC